MNANLLFGLPLVAALAAGTTAAPLDGDCASSKTKTAAAATVGKHDIVDTAIAAGQFKTLAAALQAAELVEALKGKGPFTVFAPSDQAFAQLPKGTVETLLKPENRGTLATILTYHVVPGRVMAADVVKLDSAATLSGQRVDIEVDDHGVTVDGARVVKADIECSNGVIHVIDRVILPNTNDIVDTAVEAGSFKTLATALKTAGLVEALKSDGPFTVFAPTDEAFAKLPNGTVQSLLQPENRHKLTAILKYHVVSGRVYAKDAIAAGRAATLEGSEIRARIADGRLMINDATVISSDLDAANGVIHVIDSVLLP